MCSILVPSAVATESRCNQCAKLLFKLSAKDAAYEIKCGRCKSCNSFPAPSFTDVVVTNSCGRIIFANQWVDKNPDGNGGKYIWQILCLPNFNVDDRADPIVAERLQKYLAYVGESTTNVYKTTLSCKTQLLISPITNAESVIQLIVFRVHCFT